MMRAMLYEAAHIVLVRSTKWSWLKAWAMHIARRRGMKKAIVALARGAAVLMHDSTYTAAEYAGRAGWGHSTFDAALDLAIEAEVPMGIISETVGVSRQWLYKMGSFRERTNGSGSKAKAKAAVQSKAKPKTPAKSTTTRKRGTATKQTGTKRRVRSR